MVFRVFSPAPCTEDGTLDFSIDPAFLVAVATSETFARKISTDAGFNTAVRGSNAATRPSFPVQRPQDCTLDTNTAPAFFAAVATNNEDFASNFQF